MAALLGVVLVLFTMSGGRYWRWERIVLGLAIFNGLFLVAALLTGPTWGAIGHATATFSPFPHGSINTLLLLVVSTIGATVTPWMIFFQQSASADKGMTPADIRHGRIDTVVGGILAAVFGCGALIAGAALLGHGGASISGLAGAGFPAALKHISGNAVGTLFAAAIILIPGAPLLSIALNANVLATVLLPVTLVFMIMLANDRELMGRWVNGVLNNQVAIAIVVFISLCGAAYAIDAFLQTVGVI
ncbi:MAG: divalent metal cation transporter [Solirubrobacteraceae bacterium]